MTWEAVRVILVTLAVFAAMVSGLAWLLWKRLSRLDREARGHVRISPRDKRLLTTNDSPDAWWAR
jgi:hypothetical protein